MEVIILFRNALIIILNLTRKQIRFLFWLWQEIRSGSSLDRDRELYPQIQPKQGAGSATKKEVCVNICHRLIYDICEKNIERQSIFLICYYLSCSWYAFSAEITGAYVTRGKWILKYYIKIHVPVCVPNPVSSMSLS